MFACIFVSLFPSCAYCCSCYLATLFHCSFVCLCLFVYVCLCLLLRSFVRSFVRLFVCLFVCWFVCSFVRSFVRLFACLFVCSFVRSFVRLFNCLFVLFVCLFVCLCVCCFSPFAFIFAGQQFCLFCFCSTLLRVFHFLVYFLRFLYASLCFLLAWQPPQVRIESGAWSEQLRRPKDRSAWDRCLSDSCGHKWTIGYNFYLLGSGKGLKERTRSSWSSIELLHWHWHVEFIPARFGGGSGHKSMLHALAACTSASMPRIQYSIMPENKCQLKNATGSRVSLDPPEGPVSCWQCSNVLHSTDTAHSTRHTGFVAMINRDVQLAHRHQTIFWSSKMKWFFASVGQLLRWSDLGLFATES